MNFKNILENNKKKLFWLWTLMLILVTLFPLSISISTKTSYLDKFVHIILFGIFAFLLFINSLEKFIVKKAVLISFFATSFFAALIELLQNFSPGRSCDFWDYAVGTIGGGFFLVFAFYTRGHFKKNIV